uniref:Fibrillar collagen NC1 domain-containing protein n=2 Tax=Denticeps clupeoides TaxID=299321 RepID=A0AAY4C3E9_9TELE
MYYIDPNQGSPVDAFLVSCDFTSGGRTCLPPLQPQVPMRPWLKYSEADTFNWISTMEEGFQFEYPESNVVQMKFLRLHSKIAAQNITYTCQFETRQGSRQREIKFLSNTRQQSYLATFHDCLSNEPLGSGPQESVFNFETEDLNLLPIRDLGLFGTSNLTERFTFTVGPVCFS